MPGDNPPKPVDPALEEDQKKEDLPKKTEAEILEELQSKVEKVSFVDVSSLAEDEARDAGEERITEDYEKTKGLSNIFKRIWKHNIMRDYNRFKEISKVREEIESSGNIYAGESADKAHHDMAMTAITERFLSEYDGVVREEAGEKKKLLEDGKEGVADIKTSTKKLVLDYATGKINDEVVYESERNKLLSKVKGAGKDVIGDGVIYADNLKDIVQQVKQALEHGVSIDAIDKHLNLDIVLGKATSGVKTEARTSKLENLTRSIHKSRVGALIGNETTIAAAIFGATAIATKISQSGARNIGRAAGFFGGVAVSAGILAYKENRRMKEERGLHLRERAKGMNTDPDKETPRRDEMEESLYESKKAVDLTAALLADVYVDGDPEKGVKDFSTKEELDRAIASMADIESRINLNNQEKVDLISYSKATNVESERASLEISQARAKAYLNKKLEENPELKKFLSGEDLKSALSTMTEASEKSLTKDELEEKDRIFAKIKGKAVVKAALKGAVSAAVIGTVIQEVSAFWNPKVDGALESAIKGSSVEAKSTTALRGFWEYMSGQSGIPASEIAKSAVFEEHDVAGNILRLPKGLTLDENADGTISILSDGNKIAENIPLNYNPDGTLSDSTKEAFAASGLLDAGHSTATVMETSEVHMTPQEFLEQKKEGVMQVARDLWYDNDTEAPVFDKNELATWWGGEDGTGIDTDGNYVFNISHMAENGSYHGGFSADAQELVKNGGVKMLLSMSRDTQNMVFEVPIDVNGNAIIDPDSEIGKMFFANVDGKAVFQGRFAEVAQMMGSEDGVEHIRLLSTVEGNGLEEIITKGEIPVSENINDLVYNMDRPWDYPPAIPIVGRFPLEPMGYHKKKGEDDPKPGPVDPKPKPVDPIPDPIDPVPPVPKPEGEDPKPSPQEFIPAPIFYEREITKEEYLAMKDDLILINLMIQSHEGILNLEKDQLKSEYAKERYDDLKNIGPGIPVTWNRTELRVIGDELEDMLSGSEKIVRGVEGFNDNKRNVFDLKQKYQSYAFELNNKSLKNIRQKARFIQAMKQILAEVDYLRENNRTDKTQETFLKSTKEGGVLSGVGSMNMKTPDEYMDKYIKEAESRYLKAEDSYAENQTPVRKRNLDEAFKTFEEVNATFDELVRNKDFKRNPTEEMYRIKVKAKMEDFEMEEISDEEWKAFKDQGIVSVGRLQSISKKILEKESLNDKEKEIYDDRKVQIEKGLDAEVTYLPEVSDEEWEAFTAETPVIHGDRLDDIAKKIKNGVTLSDREQDMRKALASEIEDILQKMIKAEKEVNAETKESESSEEAMEETSDSEDGGGEGSEKEKKEHLDDPITLVRKETLKAIEKGEFYVTELDNAQNILKYPELNGEYEYYTTTDPAVGFGAVTMYKFKKKGESLIMGPDGKPVKSGESEVEKVAKTPEPATPEVISSKKPGSIETKVEDVTIENLLEKKSSEITKDEWELLDQIKKDFEKKATADDLEKIDKEISNLDARIIPQPKGDFDLNNLETDYAKILYKKSESANSNRLTYRHLETVRDGLKAFSEKKRKSLDTTKEVAVEKSERESFDDKFIEDQIRDTLKGIGAIREIKNLKIEGVGDTISINTSIKAKKGPISTNVDLKADIENTKDGIGIKDGYSIKASSMEGIVKNLIEPNIKNISSSIKDHIEKEKGKKVEKIWIEDGKLKVEYSNK